MLHATEDTNFAELRALLPESETIDPSSPIYQKESVCWSAQQDLHPKLILRPTCLSSLQGIVKHLYASTFDFAIRSGGVGSSSSCDILLSMTAFDSLTFDPSSETVTVGAGQTWGDLDAKLSESAPGYAVVGARCPFVGVAGAMLTGCISWLSHEYGLGSSPQNLLDVQIVLHDGRLLWASEEPQLLWALRGGGGNLGVVAAFKLKAYRYTQSILSGIIKFPSSSKETLEAVSRRLAVFLRRCEDPKIACHVFIRNPSSPFLPGLGLLVFDANGPEHGRGEDGFKWALDIEGAVDMTRECTIKDVNGYSGGARAKMGRTSNWMTGTLVKNEQVDEAFLIRANDWCDSIIREDEGLAGGSFVLLECMQERALQGEGVAWSKEGRRHVLQVGVGYKGLPKGEEASKKAVKVLEESTKRIIGDCEKGEYLPAFYQPEIMDARALYAESFEKLKQLKERYDPQGRFTGGISFT
ncbi:hypothetical protein LTS18_003479 [Coniosporium uncinatum]|uniref:Uncharacterized protein n=1 Tax=Coniosporium uncinatum TaxID=93489 RepID=A0ACC3D736_9PEZI|nr:hypothetical protein LTS18_003479 [Coniosporium uncinatum]